MSDGEPSVDYPGFVEIACLYLADTAKAVKVNDGTRVYWVPKSQLPEALRHAFPEEGDAFTLVVTEWFAGKEGLL